MTHQDNVKEGLRFQEWGLQTKRGRRLVVQIFQSSLFMLYMSLTAARVILRLSRHREAVVKKMSASDGALLTFRVPMAHIEA